MDATPSEHRHRRRIDIAVYIALALLVAAGLWDAYILTFFGISSGRTISWKLYSHSKNWPVIGYFAGLFTCWLCSRSRTNPIVAAIFFVAGHIFGSMHGT